MTCTLKGNNCGVTLETTIEEGDPRSGLKNVMMIALFKHCNQPQQSMSFPGNQNLLLVGTRASRFDQFWKCSVASKSTSKIFIHS
jgi:hypothetical protein